MPHLETLSWYDTMCLGDNFFRTVTKLPIRHLKISRGYISDPYCLDLLAPFVMSLETLYLDVSICEDEDHENDTTNDSDAYEDGCSATIEHLYLRCMSFSDDTTLSFGHEQVDFGRLRYLDLTDCFDNPDTMAWCSLLSAPLRHLALPGSTSGSFMQSISACQPLRDLETLVLPSLCSKSAAEARSLFDFMSRHSHVRKLSVQHGDPQLMDSYLVPLLSDGTWSNLTSLSLAWRGPGLAVETEPNIAVISAESLAAIGSIKSLEQLCLRAGEPLGWRHQWLVDHEVVRSSLRGLTNLKRLAFSRDTYTKPGFPESMVESYYSYQFVASDEGHIAMERPYLDRPRSTMRMYDGPTNDDLWFYYSEVNGVQLWECAHRNRMLREAESYSRALPSLEWIYCGQWPMGFKNVQTSKGRRRISVPLGKERDSCYTLLERMFAMRGGDDD
ncbi:hypothetical protein A9Z42_0029890 [Trichoderma parareesei]|uniref:F-box domain-containing protein n=1 Tax=Trichoderma parareesei TaxID=858221 RepID=A0A2H2Z8G3_TRIPA|nr:hypothetical protein A9Z42_0029890 [Trichoderma parareesei]